MWSQGGGGLLRNQEQKHIAKEGKKQREMELPVRRSEKTFFSSVISFCFLYTLRTHCHLQLVYRTQYVVKSKETHFSLTGKVIANLKSHPLPSLLNLSLAPGPSCDLTRVA